MTQEQINKVELSEKIRIATEGLNELIKEANKEKLYVIFVQKFHPSQNHNADNLNPPLRVSITQQIVY